MPNSLNDLDEIEDDIDEELSFEKRKYGIYLDDEIEIILDKRATGKNNIIRGRYLSISDERIAIVSNKDGKVHWISWDFIVEIVCLFHRNPIPEGDIINNNNGKKHESRMFG